MKGYRKIIVGVVFLVTSIVMIFVIKDVESKKIYFDFLWKLCAVIIAGNGVEWIGQGISSYKRNGINNQIGE